MPEKLTLPSHGSENERPKEAFNYQTPADTEDAKRILALFRAYQEKCHIDQLVARADRADIDRSQLAS